MTNFTVRSCPICANPPAALTNTASATGRYVCSSGYSGNLTAVSEPLATQVVNVSVDQTVYPACTQVGRTVRYTITARNHSSLPAAQVLVTVSGIESLLEAGPVRYNGQPISGCPSDGILIPGLGAGCCACLTFDAAVPAGTAGTVTSTACAEFSFDSSACGVIRTSAASTPAVLTVVSPGLEVVKTADRCAVTPDANVVTFTLTVRNTGTCPIEGVVVTDSLPDGLVYVAGSTCVNAGAPADLNPAGGIALGTLNPCAAAEVTFRASAAF